MTVDTIERIIGARGIDPRNSNLIRFELTDRLNGEGPQLTLWDNTLGGLPSNAEQIIGANPLITLELIDNATDDGILVTATLVGGTTQLVNWRCIDPDNVVNTANANAVAGTDTWEIITGKAGSYTIQAWASTFGFAQTSYQEA
jgi:hypothetical protein